MTERTALASAYAPQIENWKSYQPSVNEPVLSPKMAGDWSSQAFTIDMMRQAEQANRDFDYGESVKQSNALRAALYEKKLAADREAALLQHMKHDQVADYAGLIGRFDPQLGALMRNPLQFQMDVGRSEKPLAEVASERAGALKNFGDSGHVASNTNPFMASGQPLQGRFAPGETMEGFKARMSAESTSPHGKTKFTVPSGTGTIEQTLPTPPGGFTQEQITEQQNKMKGGAAGTTPPGKVVDQMEAEARKHGHKTAKSPDGRGGTRLVITDKNTGQSRTYIIDKNGNPSKVQ